MEAASPELQAATAAGAIKIEDIELKVPTTWKKEKPSNNLRLAQFSIPAEKDDADKAELVISIASFPDRRTTAMALTPGGVARATIVSC